jgi:hypothetical protein
MSVRESRPSPLHRLAHRAAAVFFASGLAVSQSTPAPRLSEQVERLLAEGGCPGWIALAGDPELQTTLNAGAEHVYSGPLRETAARDNAFPRVQYPVPVRVAQAPTSATTADPDELIPESEDLLFSSPEIVKERGGASAGAAEADEPPPASSETDAAPVEAAMPASETPATPPVAEEPPAASADDLLAPDEDLTAPPVEMPVTPPAVPPPSVPDAEELLDARDDLLEPAPTVPPRPLPQQTPPPITPQVAPPHLQPRLPGPGPAPQSPPAASAAPSTGANGSEAKTQAEAAARCEFDPKSLYPSATECRACHEKIYEEWSISSHAYAFVSPMFHKFEQKINDVANGTIGYFCYRCHTPAGTSLGISRAAPIWELPLVAREGACHRINEMYGKTNGERRIEPGPVFAPVYGTIGGDGVAVAAANKSTYKVHTMPGEKTPGVDMHASAECFPQLGHSEFCTSCHQVAVYPGIKLEVVWEQYRASPACKKGIQCQDCHMGRIPGVPSGYEFGPAAEINKKNVHPNRKHSNHVFFGPGYSIAHPGVFPFNPKAERWNVRDWLLFDWRAGWGTDEFEDAIDDGRLFVAFPEVWKEADDRYDAREIIDDNLKKKKLKDHLRGIVMENGSHVDGPFFDAAPRVGQELKFSYVVINTNEGHNLPTASLGAQPQLWANVVLISPRGQRLWETGYLDSNGDLADIHSVDVREKRLPFDWQLFNLQTMFLITGAKGTDREFYLPVNIDIDPLPFIRPAPQPVSVLNHPPFIRMEARSLAPLGSRNVPYKVPGHLLCAPGRYRLSFRMRSRLEPLYFMRFCESTTEMQRAMLEGTLDFHESSVEFDVR